MEIAGADAGGNDSLVVTGELKLNDGQICLDMADACGLCPGERFYAVLTGSNSDSIISQVNDHVVSHYFTNLQYVPYGDDQFAITGILDPSAVPEPSAWALLILGTFGLMYFRKRK